MDKSQAKGILALYRPGSSDAEDPHFTEALALAKRDPELQPWFEAHCAEYAAFRAQLKRIAVPAD